VDAALSQLKQWLVSRAQLRAEVIDAASVVLRFTRARSQEEAERIVRGQLLGLGPWSEKVLFAASFGVPQLDSGTFNVVGEGTLGYNDVAWGIVGQGGASVYDFSDATSDETTAKFFGGGDAWYSLALSETTRADFRGTGEAVVFDTDSTLVDDTGAFVFTGTEESLLIRGGALIGLRHQAPNLGVGGWAGGGFQLNSFGNFAATADEEVSSDDDSVGGYGHLRMRLQWGFLPDALALRVSLDGKYYQMARIASQADASGVVDTESSSQQLEAIGRVFLDLEAARLFDFVPGAGVGLDHYQLAVNEEGTKVTTVPVYMLGVRRTTF
jgi:hypothetical protein